MQAESLRRWVEPAFRVVVGVGALAYACGLVITNLYLRNYGTFSLSVNNAQFVMTGLLCFFLLGDRAFRFRAKRKKIATRGLKVWQLLRELQLGHFGRGKLATVYSEVNPLKHEPAGLAKGRRVSPADAIDAFGEMLELLETP